MTVDQALALLKELRALERLMRAITEPPSPALEWRAALVALDDRARLLRYVLSADEALLATIEEIYRQELVLELPADVQPQLPHLATSGRIH